MELVPIILAIIAITLFYFLYAYFATKPTILINSVTKLGSSSPTEIKPSGVSNYAYGVWVFVDSVNSSASTIISREDNFKITLTGAELKLGLCTVAGSSYVDITYTDNFPIQKWTHVGFCVSNSYADLYLDGKLVKSKLVKDTSNRLPLKPDTSKVVNSGAVASGHSISITKLKYWDDNVMPDDMWNEYIEGNGQSQIMNKLSSYGANITILKDGIEQNMFSL
jgi:hypothetical protein